MPRLDDPSVQKFLFKKKEYRAWDDNAFDQLKIKSTEISTEKQKKDIETDIETDIGKINRYQNGYQKDKNDANRYQNSDQIRYQNGHQNGYQKRYHSAVVEAPQERTSTCKSDLKLQVRTLSGHQLNLFKFLVNCCIDNGELLTGPITIREIQNTTKIGILSLKLAIMRLTEKKIIVRKEGKKGRSGFQNFLIPREAKEAGISIVLNNTSNLMQSKKDIEIDIKKDIKMGIEMDTSSSSFINTTTTEMTESEINFDGLKNIDIEPLSDIGFSTQHLSQLINQKKLSPDVIQESINAFAFDLKENNKAKSIKGLPLNFFMGVLGKGKPYLPPPNYESPEDRDIRLYIERKKELEKARLEREEELLRLASGEWLESLSEEEKQALMPEDAKKSTIQGFKMASLRNYFKENLWAEKRAEFLAKG